MKYTVLKFGLSVFNGESSRFRKWLSKPNASIGGKIPAEMLDSEDSIKELKDCLNRIEFGNFS